MTDYRILLVAPDYEGSRKLENVAEVRSIQNAFRTEQLRSLVTVKDLYDLTRDQQFDVIHFAAHGSSDGIDLGGEILSLDMMARIVRKAQAKLVYFNSCDSAQLGQYLLNRGMPAVIMTSTEIADVDAWSMAGYYYAELQRNGGDFRAAYRMVRDEDGMLIWLSNGSYVDPNIQPIIDGITTLREITADNANRIDAASEQRREEAAKLLRLLLVVIVVSILPDVYLYWQILMLLHRLN